VYEALVLLVVPPAAVAGGLWSIVAALTWRRAWRLLAAVPLAAFLLWVAVYLVPDWAKDPTSHNLWPFEAGFWFWPSLPYMAVVTFVRSRRIERAP
jgi:hypothetical protein